MAGKKFDFKTMHFSDIPAFFVALVKGEAGGPEEMLSGQTGKYEINLVPDVKIKMIEMMKIRNLVLFICIVAATVAGVITAVLGSTKAAQDITMADQDKHLTQLSKTITGYSELPEFLTLQNQLSKISEIEKKQLVLSRIFPIMATMVPACNLNDPSKAPTDDSICLSELNVDLSKSTVSFDATADAKVAPFIDYRVLEAFKKTVSMMNYDYGRYVDANGHEIPTRCIKETKDDGSMYIEAGSIYAIWKRGEKGCDPDRDDYATDADGSVEASNYNLDIDESDSDSQKTDDDAEDDADGSSSKKSNKPETTTTTTTTNTLNATTDSSLWNTNYLGENSSFGVISTKIKTKTSTGEEDITVTVVPDEKIYRTPLFDAWSKDDAVVKTASDGYADVAPADHDNIKYKVKNYTYHPEMSTDGAISNVPHFESQCITYSGVDDIDENGKTTTKWSATNSCVLAPEGITITDSSNGRDADENLVLNFSATIEFDPQVFAYNNKHVMAISPTKQNVTDSYNQTENMFSAPAENCSSDDTACTENSSTKESN